MYVCSKLLTILTGTQYPGVYCNNIVMFTRQNGFPVSSKSERNKIHNDDLNIYREKRKEFVFCSSRIVKREEEKGMLGGGARGIASFFKKSNFEVQ